MAAARVRGSSRNRPRTAWVTVTVPGVLTPRIDVEVRKLIDSAHDEAVSILRSHRATLDKLASALIDQETLDTPQLMEILGDLPPWAAKRVVPEPEPQPIPTAAIAAATAPPAASPAPVPEGWLRRLRRAVGGPAPA